MPSITIVIPTYNAGKTILETIASVQQQTFSDFEVIVINDGSTDDLLERLSTVADPRLKIFSYENGGLSVARNRGIARSTGEFIAFLDADDLWSSDKLELQLQALQSHPKAGVAYSWTYFMDEQGQSVHEDEPIHFEGDVYADLLVWNFLAHGSNPLIRRSAIESVGEFNPSVSGAADWDYWLRLAEKWEFVVIPKPQVFYRQSSSSMSSRVDFMEQCQLDVAEQAFERAPTELRFLKNRSLANIYRYSAQLYIMRVMNVNGIQQAGYKLWTAIQLYPAIILQRKTQKLIFKLLLLLILPSGLSRHLLKQISYLKAKQISTESD